MLSQKQRSNKRVSINKKEYEALIQCVKVTDEYLKGKGTSFDSSEKIINNLKKLK